MRDHEPGMHAAVFRQKCRKPVGQRGIHHALQPTLRHIGVLAERNPQKVHCKRNGLAVEIAARDYLIFPGENQRVIGYSVDLAAQDIPHIADGITAGAVNLRNTADRIGILHLIRVQCKC